MTLRQVLLSLVCLAASAAHAAVPSDYPTSVWVNAEEGWVVETRPCDSGLCGYLVGYRVTHPDDPDYVARDTHNPDPAKRGQALCGLMLMGGFNPSKRVPGKWEDGWIYDPDTGETYSGTVTVVDADTVKLRGYVGIPLFGRTMTLRRETGARQRCPAPPAP